MQAQPCPDLSSSYDIPSSTSCQLTLLQPDSTPNHSRPTYSPHPVAVAGVLAGVGVVGPHLAAHEELIEHGHQVRVLADDVVHQAARGEEERAGEQGST